MFDPIIYTKCIDFAARKHRDQRRKDPESTPYINHPIGKMKKIAAENERLNELKIFNYNKKYVCDLFYRCCMHIG